MDVTARDEAVLSLEAAVDLTRTGDVWLFRGRSAADHAIRAVTNAPVNHVGMAVVLDDLPPLMWHAELGQGLLDVWTGTHQRCAGHAFAAAEDSRAEAGASGGGRLGTTQARCRWARVVR